MNLVELSVLEKVISDAVNSFSQDNKVAKDKSSVLNEVTRATITAIIIEYLLTKINPYVAAASATLKVSNRMKAIIEDVFRMIIRKRSISTDSVSSIIIEAVSRLVIDKFYLYFPGLKKSALSSKLAASTKWLSEDEWKTILSKTSAVIAIILGSSPLMKLLSDDTEESNKEFDNLLQSLLRKMLLGKDSKVYDYPYSITQAVISAIKELKKANKMLTASDLTYEVYTRLISKQNFPYLAINSQSSPGMIRWKEQANLDPYHYETEAFSKERPSLIIAPTYLKDTAVLDENGDPVLNTSSGEPVMKKIRVVLGADKAERR